MKSGYTTGACAAAGVKAALLFEAGMPWQSVKLTALDGTELTIPIKAVVQSDAGICAEVVKFSGDDLTSRTASLYSRRCAMKRAAR